MYRLIQGDCLSVMDELIKDGVKVDAIITDPPYIDYPKVLRYNMLNTLRDGIC